VIEMNEMRMPKPEANNTGLPKSCPNPVSTPESDQLIPRTWYRREKEEDNKQKRRAGSGVPYMEKPPHINSMKMQ
jgi:hypothetical protein